MNWGGFGSGFSQGFNNGVRMGETFNKAIKQKKIDDVRAQGIAEAQAARQSEAESMIKDSGAPAAEAQPTPVDGEVDKTVETASVKPASDGVSAPMPLTERAAPMPATTGVKRFSVGDQSYATREEALAAANKKLPDIGDYVMNKIAPKLRAAYIEAGDLDQAERLGQYMESQRGKEAVRIFGGAMQKLMFSNDVNGGVQALGDYYNKYIDDGVDFTKGEVGEDGKINITVKNRGDGAERVMSLTKSELVRMGMAYDPAQLFKMGLQQVEAEEKARAEIAKETRDLKGKIIIEDRKDAREDRKDERRADRELENIVLRAELEAATKKVTDPTERRAIIVTEISKNPLFSNKSRDEINAEADKWMSVIYGDKNKPGTPSPADGKGQPSASAAPQFVRDTRTGQVFKIENGQRVPVNMTPRSEAPPTPAAAGIQPQASAAPLDPRRQKMLEDEQRKVRQQLGKE